MKRSPLPKRAASLFRGFEQEAKQKKCKACKKLFTPLRMGQKACSPACALELAQSARLKRERKEDKAKLEGMKPLSHWLDLTQKVVNEYIRARDAHLPCVSCGTTNAAMWDAGHMLSRGARPNLRFEPLNIHKQCAKCNRFASADVQQAFRAEVINRIGLDMVEKLEADHEPRKFTREQLEEIRAHYRAKLRELRGA